MGTLKKAIDTLTDLLAAGPVPARTVFAQAMVAKMSTKTLKRAKRQLGIISAKSSFMGGWVWTLPEAGQLEWPSSEEYPWAEMEISDSFLAANVTAAEMMVACQEAESALGH